ncbi:MAG: NAD-dependent dehydratase [Rhodospirillaceae bacterium]|nr:NAD-dependent dehydratase [Rhodospirillaceae bacterium]|tara:strand:+ start:5361 stop:6287 length:927 start_codon:yes stop_codon:yes gene_type:complete
MSDLLFNSVAVTGGSGLLGRYVVRELMGDCEVRVLDLKPLPEDVPWHQVDSRDLDGVRAALRGCDAVVHLAALDDGIVPEEEAFIDVNLRGTWHVLQAAEELGIGRVVIASSVAAVGVGDHNPPMVLPVPVDGPLRPKPSYGVTKKVCEEFARTFVRRGALEVISLRPCLVAQPDIAYAIAQIAAEMEAVEPPPPATGAAWRDLRETLSTTRAIVTPDDVARAFRAALSVRGLSYGAYFITGPDTCGHAPTIDLVSQGFGITPEIARPSVYADDPRASAYDLVPAREELGWEPRDRWADYLARVIAAG